MEGSQRFSGRIDLATAPEQEVEEALARWDELPPETLEVLARDPVHGPRLSRLQLAEAWLAERAADGAPATVTECPDAEELFDYGRGPGYRPLPSARRAQLDRHVLRCEPCREFAATLQRRPPVPLEILPLHAGSEPGSSAPPDARATRLRLVRAALPLAAAAAVMALALPRLLDRGEALPAFPERPLLRDGGDAAALLAPRGALLRANALAPERRIELAAVPRAEHYRVQLLLHGGGAFEAGEPIGELLAEVPHLALPDLAPGRYTLAAWVRVDGLDQPLGRRDFQVVLDLELEQALERAAGPGPLSEATLRRLVRDLDARSYWTDARAVARRLPASPEREAYLSAPGR